MLGFGGRLDVVAVDVTAGTRGTNHAGGGTDIEVVPKRARFPCGGGGWERLRRREAKALP